MFYRRKAILVECFVFGREPQPQWFIDETQNGEKYDEGNGVFYTFRLKGSKRILRVRDGDFVLLHRPFIWVCEYEAFNGLYEVAVPENEVAVQQVSASVMIMTISAAGICLGIALGYWLGAGFGWAVIALLIFAIGMLRLSMLPTKENE